MPSLLLSIQRIEQLIFLCFLFFKGKFKAKKDRNAKFAPLYSEDRAMDSPQELMFGNFSKASFFQRQIYKQTKDCNTSRDYKRRYMPLSTFL